MTDNKGGLTTRQHAAIALRVPDSGDPVIDRMIRVAVRRDLMAQMAAAYIAHLGARGIDASENILDCASEANYFANAMLIGMEKGL